MAWCRPNPSYITEALAITERAAAIRLCRRDRALVRLGSRAGSGPAFPSFADPLDRSLPPSAALCLTVQRSTARSVGPSSARCRLSGGGHRTHPFLDNALTRHVDPVKFYEYRAAGLGVLSTRFGTMSARGPNDQVLFFDAQPSAPALRALAQAAADEHARASFAPSMRGRGDGSDWLPGSPPRRMGGNYGLQRPDHTKKPKSSVSR